MKLIFQYKKLKSHNSLLQSLNSDKIEVHREVLAVKKAPELLDKDKFQNIGKEQEARNFVLATDANCPRTAL